MSTKGLFFRYWLPALVMMGIIAFGSSQTFSAKRTSRFLDPALKWLFPSASESTRDAIEGGIRKSAHVTEYALLAILFGRAIRTVIWGLYARFTAVAACITLLFTGLYATADEYRQSMIASRTGSPYDVMLDIAGGFLGIALLFLFHRVRPPSRPQAERTASSS